MGLPPLPEDLSFEGQTILITGSNTGVGLEVARAYLRHKASTVYLVVRSEERGNNAIKLLKEDPVISKDNPSANIQLYQCDQSSYASVKAFAAKIRDEVKFIDTAVLNSGVNFVKFEPTQEGLESNFHVNYFGAAMVALELLPLLHAAAKEGLNPHLFFMSSLMHKNSSYPWKKSLANETNLIDVLGTKEVFTMNAYGTSKLFLTMFTEELAKYEKDVVVTSGCPGVVQSELDRNMPGWLYHPVALFKRLMGREPYLAAETIMHAMITDKTGTYWANGVVTPHASVLDTMEGQAAQKRLFNDTVKRCKEIDPNIAVSY